MGSYVVKQGDYLLLIARRLGFADWRTIYDHPGNEGFRKKRPDPNVIKPGDVLFIPDKKTKTVEVATGQQHRFRVKLPPPPRLEVVLKGSNGKAIADAPYTLFIDDKTEQTGTTDGEGKVSATLSPGATTVVLSLDRKPWMSWRLDVGHLDPVRDGDEPVVTGVQARLNNLGYFCGAVDGVAGPRTRAAIVRFQHKVLGRSQADGKLDTETLDALLREHGS